MSSNVKYEWTVTSTGKPRKTFKTQGAYEAIRFVSPDIEEDELIKLRARINYHVGRKGSEEWEGFIFTRKEIKGTEPRPDLTKALKILDENPTGLIAERTGMKPNTISIYKMRKRGPSSIAISKILKAFS